MKVGGVRISLDPNPFKKGLPFRQELILRDGVCEIMAGEQNSNIKLVVFVDSNSPVIYVDGGPPQTVKGQSHGRCLADRAAYARGRRAEFFVDAAWFADRGYRVSRHFSGRVGNAVAWYHRNETSPAFAATLKVQSLESVANQARDPLLHRTFGGCLTAAGSAIRS